MRRCANCRQPYTPTYSTLVNVCGSACADAWVKARPERAAKLRKAAIRKERREWRHENESVPSARGKAQDAFNAWVRARDADMPCISCGRYDLADPLTGGRWDAGHFRTIAACPQLRFEPDNCHRQCKFCNEHRAQSVEHEAGVLARIGPERMAWIKGPHPLPHWRRDDYRAIEADYKARLRMMRRAA